MNGPHKSWKAFTVNFEPRLQTNQINIKISTITSITKNSCMLYDKPHSEVTN